jgi:hypothetical protein
MGPGLAFQRGVTKNRAQITSPDFFFFEAIIPRAGQKKKPRRTGRGLSFSACYSSILVPSTSRNLASHAGWAGQAGAVTSTSSTWA